MNVIRFISLLLASATSISVAADSVLWEDFVEASVEDREPILPDFSFAGYRFSEAPIPDVGGAVFSVTDYGAVADDGLSDRDAIQAAVDAAETAGGGVVLFPSGQFHLNTLAEPENPIVIRSGGIVWRGAGRGRDGTILAMERHLEALNPDVLYSTPFMIQVRPTLQGASVITTVTGFGRREGRTLTLADTSNLVVGQWITLALSDPDAVPAFLDPYTALPAWTRLWTEGIQTRERHRIASISGQEVTLAEPLHVEVDPAYDWEIWSYRYVEGIGFEDIRFQGGWVTPFIHHRSALDDGGWSALKIDNTVNSWIRRCVFVNWNYGVKLEGCSAFSVEQVSFEGNKGHYGIHTRRGYGVLIGPGRDLASHCHGPSLGYQSAGTVYWRFQYEPDTSFDAHSGTPYATLLDQVTGGLRYWRSGGPTEGMPNHLRHFVLWNFEQTGAPVEEYDFWSDDPTRRDRYVKPIVAGFHGVASTFRTDHLQIEESHGVPVEPASLFEAQLELRLGELPEAIRDLPVEWEAWEAVSLPAGQVFLNEGFDYGNGELAVVSGGSWVATESGLKNPSLAVESGRLLWAVTGGGVDNIDGAYGRVITPAPWQRGYLYAGFRLEVREAPESDTGDVVASFWDGDQGFRTLVWLARASVGGSPVAGSFRLGVSDGSTDSGDVVWADRVIPQGTRVQLVIRYDPSEGKSRLWIDPSTETDPSVGASGSSVLALVGFSFHHRDQERLNRFWIDDLKVAESFGLVAPGKRLLDEPFYYPDGPIVGQGGWSESGNTASKPEENTDAIRVVGGRLKIAMDPIPAQGVVIRSFSEVSIESGRLYAGMLIRVTGLPTSSGVDPANFAGFASASGNAQRPRVWVTEQSETTGEYRLGVTAVSGSREDVSASKVLKVGVEYLAVFRLDFDPTGGTVSLWIDPESESDEWVEQTGTFNTAMSTIYLRQDDRLVGHLEVLRLAVGDSFEQVLLDRESDGSSYLANLSTRGAVVASPGALIAGFVMAPDSPEQILARGIGPGLGAYGVSGVLEHAELKLADAVGDTVGFNDGWSKAPNAAAIETAAAAAGAFPLVENSDDSAVLIDLPSGLYSARLAGADGGGGLGLIELYPGNPEDANLANISTRGYAGTGAEILIPGFVVGGDRAKQLLIRGIGPSLQSFGIPSFLEDPQLVVLANDKTILAENDDWNDSEDAEAITAIGAYVGAFPLEADSSDAAVLVTLEPGVYTVKVSGVAEGTGIALVEVYAVD